MLQDLTKFLVAHDKVLEYDFDTYIEGHLTVSKLLKMFKFKKNPSKTFKQILVK